MTTIAYDGYDLATDSLVTEGSVKVDKLCKIYHLDNGGHLAFCGDAHVGQIFADWQNGKREAPPEELMKNSAVLLIDKDKRAWEYDGTAQVCLPVNIPYAKGTGLPFALAAMDAGLSASDAVKAAIKRDIYSGGKVNVVSINKRKEKKAKDIE